MDATLDDEPTTGISLYGVQLGRALEALGVRVERLGARQSGEAPRKGLSRTAWTVGVLPELLRTRRLYHALGNFNLPLAPPSSCACVLTVHDLIPLTHPGTVSPAFRLQFRAWLSRALRISARVICVSRHTERELLERFPETAGRTRVVHHGVEHLASVVPDAAAIARVDALALPEQFVLYAGSLDVRKNVQLLLEAMERLGPGVCLVLVGQRWFGSGPVERRLEALMARGHDIRAVGHLPAGVFRELLSRATAFAFPSRAEGFGLPPLEAMAAGVPVVSSNAGALAEVCGEAAQLVDPDDAAGLAEALGALLASPTERQRWIVRGQAHAARFTWEAAAQRTLSVYREVL